MDKKITSNQKPQLVILSDLWGKGKSDWLKYYTKYLEVLFEIKYYDCCELAEIDVSKYDKDSLHQEFINGGIEKAIQNFTEKEPGEISILAFSIGGIIAWKSMLAGISCTNFFAVSSTRLRKEIKKPTGFIQLFYGENDPYQPTEKWFNDVELDGIIFQNENHNFYQKKNVGKLISQKIIQHLKNSNPS